MRWQKRFVFAASMGLAPLALVAQEKSAVTTQPIGVAQRTAVDQLPSIKELPDPFLFADGSRVQSKEDWPRRQAELKQLIQTYEYGHLPPAPHIEEIKVTDDAAYVVPPRDGADREPKPATPEKYDYPEGTQVLKLLVMIRPRGNPHAVSFHVLLTVPPGKGPFPAIVRDDLCWGRVRPEIAADIARRGYILAEFDRTEVVPDKKGPRDSGLYLVYPDGDFSASAAWAWGYHRTIDYLFTRADVDKQKIVVTGHSRGGKAAIFAGLMDDRVALTAPNCSGCGGAGCYRYQAPKSEAIQNILKNFPYWFQPEFAQFIGKEDRLPIDQHEVKAAIAPRAFFETEATGDLWANPEGSQVTYSAAKEVYEWLGVGDRIAIRYRPGIHEHNQQDWHALLDFADGLFSKKKGTTKFDNLAFPNAPKIWSWKPPQK